ncbi:MAG: hypothetical protein CBB87_01495 [Micavibrio sp. TMED27]|nr:hypothetical protein [Micavibrio sp.]OUT92443.1 MAG: hypothetical protein CBB87_01495 [Micavibrio sp. TMED27]|tara:strand:- start:564 stop:1301 length:738 start_codon:yes stop_codon:yes gene_type:complete
MRNLVKLICSLILIVLFAPTASANEENKELVILLHGIGHSEWNMAGIESALQKAGYQTLNIGYPSLKKDLGTLSTFINDALKKEKVWDGRYKKVHFTTHSMGGLVLRGYLDKYKSDIPKNHLGRTVMLAPPNGGSEVADLLENFSPYQWLFGPAGQELTTEEQEKIKADIYYDLGIIAGNKEWPYIIAAHIIPNKSDGRVAVEKTKLKGMKDHITLSATHSFISWKPSVYKQIIHFLKHGAFKHG